MQDLIGFAQAQIVIFSVSTLLIILYKMMTGSINTRGMLEDKVTHDFSPGRVQLLMFTLFAAFYYLSLISQSIGDSAQKFIKLPELPDEILVVLGGSHGVYLSGKALPLLASFFKSLSDNR